MSSLSQIPPDERRRMARTLFPLAVTVLVAGLLPLALSTSVGWKLVGIAVVLIATLLLGIAVGLRTSAATDKREGALDAAILATAGSCGAACGTEACGVADCAVKALPRG